MNLGIFSFTCFTGLNLPNKWNAMLEVTKTENF